jgi:hypothetical protein
LTDSVIASATAVVALIALTNLSLTLALAKRLRLTDHRPVRAGDEFAVPAGHVVTPFQASTTLGERVTESTFDDRTTIAAFVSVGCTPCVKVKNEILKSQPSEPLLVFVGGPDTSTPPELASDLSEAADVVWFGEDSAMRDAFAVRAFPTVLKIVNGVVIASGRALRDIQPASG